MEGGIDSINSAAKGAALLLVIGEPFSEEHKTLILGEISKGFRCWDTEATGIDINDELAQIANKADLGEEGPNGERIVRYSSENLTVEILVNPQTQSVNLGVKNLLTAPTKHKHMIYAGHAFQGSGAWILQDDTYTFSNFAHAFKDQDVGNAIRQQHGSILQICTGADGDWSNGHIAKNDFSKTLDVKLNPTDKLETLHGVLQFTAYLSNFVRVRQLNELLQSSDVVGNIRFSRPTLYIFPGCQGDSALFGISGFNLLVNGGYSRKACFWDFTRHLDRIDAALMTHLGTDNLYGFGSVLQRKSIENVHPEIGYMYVNASEKIKALPQNESSAKKEENLHVNLAEEGNKLIQYAKQIGPIPQSCARTQSGQTVEPINLYHKVGIGSLDMYILNPITDSKEMKEFYQQWNQNVANFGTNQQMPLPNTLSVCALLVWRPSDPNDNITRIFFPGNAPQHKVLEGLEKLKTLDILKHPQCTKASLTAKPAAKKPSGLASRPPTRSKVSPVTTPRNEAAKKEIKEQPTSKLFAPKTKSIPPPSLRAKKEKEDVNKKMLKAPEKGNKAEKTDKSKKTSSPPKGSARSSTSSTPKQVASPVKEPAAVKAVKATEVKAPPPAVVPDILDPAPPAEPDTTPALNGIHDSSVDPLSFAAEPLTSTPMPVSSQPDSLIDIAPDSVPEPSQLAPETETASQNVALDRESMLELGIYDEEHDIEQDLNAQRNNSDERMPQMFGAMADSMHQDQIDDLNDQNVIKGSYREDLMSGSFHEAQFDNKQLFDVPSYVENGGTSVDDLMTPENETSEEIQPQALPEPVAYAPESYGQEPDVIPTIGAKEESEAISQTEVTPTFQEPDLLPIKQEAEESHGYEEESTQPVKDHIGSPDFLETPDEVENTLPEDIQEKDLSEETEKKMLPSEPIVEITPDEHVAEEMSPSQPEETVHSEPVAENRTPSEPIIESFGTGDIKEGTTDFESDFIKEANEQPVVEKYSDKTDELELETEIMPETEELATDTTVNKAVHEFSPEPALPVQENEIELEADLNGFDSLEDTDVIERPSSPEPNKQEQDQIISESIKDSFEPQQCGIDFVDKTEDQQELEKSNTIENDYRVIEETIAQPESVEEDGNRENTDLSDTPDSEEERAESPDSQIDLQDINRDSLERDDIKENSPASGSDDQRDSIEREGEIINDSVAASVEQVERDSIERSLSPSEERSLSPSEETGQGSSHRSLSPGRETEPQGSVERSVSPDEKPDQRDSVERSLSPDVEPEHRESTDKSYEEETDESDEDEDEESSSFEQEEATDEKCLIIDSVSENQQLACDDGKLMETDSLAPHANSLADQSTDNLLTPESEYTDASHGGQLGYQEIDEQDGDSDEGIEDKDTFASLPVKQTHPFGDGFEQFDGPGYAAGPMGNPFEMTQQPGTNPFIGNEQSYEPDVSRSPDDVQGSSGDPAGFNPLAQWGEPMGLPAPAEEKSEATGTKKATPKSKPGDSKKPTSDTKKATSATKRLVSAPKPAPSNGVPDKSKSRLSMGGTNANTSRLSFGGRTAAKPRPATAPAKDKDVTDSKSRVNGAKRPATSTGSRTSPATTKLPPLPPFHPFYVDLTYIPNHGNLSYSDVEYFKRVRARYYVLSALSPNTHILDALLEGKKTWEDKSLSVTVIPTYDNETLRLWMALHKERLADENVEIAPSASRCTIQLQDHETSSSAYRLEF